MISTEFICICRKSTAWIKEGETTPPCPHCGRVYKGVYNKRLSTLEAEAIRRDKQDGE